MGKGIRTAPRDALITDSVSESKVGRAFGIHRTIDQIGAIVGPIAAFGLLQIVDIRGIFLLSLIPGAIAVLILVFFVKEVAVKKSSATKTTIFEYGPRNKRQQAFCSSFSYCRYLWYWSF